MGKVSVESWVIYCVHGRPHKDRRTRVCLFSRESEGLVVLHMLHAIHIPWPVFIITEVFCVTRAPLYVYMIGAITINIECPQVRTNSEMLEFYSFLLGAFALVTW